MRIGTRGVALALLTSFLLAGCATPGDSAERAARAHFLPGDPNGALFADAFQNIEDYYLEPVEPETVALAGLKALAPPDGRFEVDDSAGAIRFLDRDTLVKQMPIPAPDDAEGWAAVVSAGMAAARAHVPALAKLDNDALDQAVFKGMITKLDRFTRYAPPQKAIEQRDDRDGFGGIGIIIDDSSKAILVSSVLPDTPAAGAGMAGGDAIVAVDGKPVVGLDRDHVVDMLRGPEGSPVTVSVLRAGATLVLHMNRALIVPPTVVAETAGPDIAALRITEFNHDTGQSVRHMLAAALKAAPQGGLRGVVLDLRGNPGGLLDQAVDVASIFVRQGRIVTTRGRNPGSDQDLDADDDAYLSALPLVVLVNGGSASASEVVAAALQDTGRAVLVGTSSYGKGTVQIVLRLENDGEFTLTWARLFPPGGYVLHRHGVVPLFCTAPGSVPPPMTADRAVAAGLDRAGPWTAPRASLTESAWKALRRDCAPSLDDSPLDLPVARRLIENASLYRQALAKTKEIAVPAPIQSLANLPPP